MMCKLLSQSLPYALFSLSLENSSYNLIEDYMGLDGLANFYRERQALWYSKMQNDMICLLDRWGIFLNMVFHLLTISNKHIDLFGIFWYKYPNKICHPKNDHN